VSDVAFVAFFKYQIPNFLFKIGANTVLEFSTNQKSVNLFCVFDDLLVTARNFLKKLFALFSESFSKIFTTEFLP